MNDEQAGRSAELEQLERKARKQVREQKSFYQHASLYLLFCVFFIALNLITSPGDFWAIWPILGWGIGVAAHALSVFGAGFGRQWEERKVRELVLQAQHGLSADEVRQLLHDELRTGRTLPNASEWERMQRRLENLEAIVTSKDWDLLHDTPGLLDEPYADPPAEAQGEEATPAQRAENLSRRVR